MIEKINIKDIVANNYGLTDISDIDFYVLARNLDREGGNSLCPIIVRKSWEKYIIVDWVQRYRACLEIGVGVLHCIVKDLNEKEAITYMIMYNKHNGRLDRNKVAELIIDLKENYDVNNFELQDLLWYEPEDIFWFEMLSKNSQSEDIDEIWIDLDDLEINDGAGLLDFILDDEEDNNEVKENRIIIEITKKQNEKFMNDLGQSNKTKEQFVFDLISKWAIGNLK